MTQLRLSLWLLLCVALVPLHANAQAPRPGLLDYDTTHFAVGDGANGPVLSMSLQPDGKPILCGNFTEYGGQVRPGIARLNPDGTLDETFDPGTGAWGYVFASIIQPDGKIIVAGEFESFNGVTQPGIVRLNEDGTIDATFTTGTGASHAVMCAAMQHDGKIVIGGAFTSFNGSGKRGIARLNPDGSLDAGFAAPDDLNGSTMAVVVQPDGRLVIAGNFTRVHGATRNGIARLNFDGSLDETFDPGKGAQGDLFAIGVRALAVQPDGKVLAAGGFTIFDDVPRRHLVRLNIDGSVDQTFDLGDGANNVVRTIALQSDGKVVIGGDFTAYDSRTLRYFARLNPDGSSDPAFFPGEGADGPVLTTLMLPDHKMLIGGMFSSVQSENYSGIARINHDGTLRGFNRGAGAGTSSLVEPFIVQPDGKVVFAGVFDNYNGVNKKSIARLHPDGTIDETFDSGDGANDMIYLVLPHQDGKILIEGSFTEYDGVPRPHLALLNSDGSLDESFDPGTSDGDIWTTSVQEDGKIIVAGTFTEFDGEPAPNIVRLNADGSVDDTFDPGTGTNGIIHRNPVLPDGKILLAGSFTEYDGNPRSNLVRIHSDGSIDENFDAGSGPNNRVYTVALQPDGKFLIGGSFTEYDGMPVPRIARINEDGSLDTSFDPGTGPDALVRFISLQEDGKILVGGLFDSFNEETARRIVRLHPDGSLDTTFYSENTFSGQVLMCGPHPSGKVIITGNFSQINDVPIARIAFLHGGKQYQTIDFSTLAPRDYGVTPFPLQATASSGLPVSYTSSNPAVATVSSDVLIIHGGGLTSITAYHPGDETYHPHTGVSRLLVVNKLDQTITFDALNDRSFSEESFSLTATSGSGEPVSFHAATENITITGTNVTFVAPGPATVVATQPGDHRYNPAAEVSRTFCINPPAPTITAGGLDPEHPVLTSSSAEGNQWYLNGNAIDGAVNATYTAQGNGVYTVSASVEGCSGPPSEPYQVLYTSIAETETAWKVFPNPSQSTVNVVLPADGKERTIRFYDVLGRLVSESRTNDAHLIVPVAGFSPGRYVVIIQEDRRVYHFPLLKE